MIDKINSPLSLQTSDKGIQMRNDTGREIAERGLQSASNVKKQK